jgi:DNA-3-methyladenine glycosylase
VRAARGLLGQILVRRWPDRPPLAFRIVETEAYLGPEDPAAHAFGGRTARNAPLFAGAGRLYVYFIYGMHHCLNLAVDRDGFPGCVLVRGAEPLAPELAPVAGRGPGRLCRTLEIDRGLSGLHLFAPGAPLTLREGPRPPRIGVSTRIGLAKAADRPLRFFDPRSASVSPGGRVV